MFGLFEQSAELAKPAILPEDIRYALQYRDGKFTPLEVSQLLRHNSEFLDVGLYLSLKLYDQHPDQKEYLDSIIQAISAGRDPSIPARAGLLKLEKHQQVVGKKAVLLSRRGNDAFMKRFEEIAKTAYEAKQTPYLVGYAGLIGLRTAIDHMPQDSVLGIVLADQSKEKKQLLGYHVSKNSTGELVVLDGLPPQADQSICLIDDAKDTGETSNILTSLLRASGRTTHVQSQFAAIMN